MIHQFKKSDKNLPAGRLLNSRGLDGRNIGPCGQRTHNSTTTAADLNTASSKASLPNERRSHFNGWSVERIYTYTFVEREPKPLTGSKK